ncbi:MAG: hypothetical protein UT84_C0017G0016 [Candidatus Curtissbacteria bacterium GW2011_GWA1_40_16]|uniref:CxxC-x17-CxxC domain-containing protein n=1 Tax=Candidatus Curtissbacteria bacterium GW2011_GWA1_40_16 TaxID=1618405 RepID=A0A0G0RC12_9BACT|nr:MAG: hypothetical protein UT84_C0017G0016 [Candidatus Curtissbacteria bacterium GW2011_GWA1_40_16]
MSDDDKTKTDEVAEEAAEEEKADEKPAEEAEVEEKEAEDKPAEEAEAQEPKADKPAEDKAASGDAASAGVDQQGRQLYNVKCSNCGKDTQVPFKPSGDRPVYCRDAKEKLIIFKNIPIKDIFIKASYVGSFDVAKIDTFYLKVLEFHNEQFSV